MSLARTYNDVDNQQIIEKLVRRELVHCVSGWVEACLRSDYDDWNECYSDSCAQRYTHFIKLPSGKHWECDDDERQGRLDELAGLIAVASDAELEALEAEREAIDAADEGTPPEVYEWWIVTEWAAGKLLNLREVVIESPHGDWIWGRQTTGQAVFLDYIWGRIADGMEILAGQRFTWDDKAGGAGARAGGAH